MLPLDQYLPFWNRLDPADQAAFTAAVHPRRFAQGTILHNGANDCIGLLLVTSGQLRVFTVSSEGHEITLYRLFDRDLCLFSASCILRGVTFDVTVEAERDTEVLHIPSELYHRLMERSAPVANFTNELMAERFSDVMWLMDQILNHKLDTRLAALLLEERALAGSDTLNVTHEQLAAHLGSAREVVTRMLRYFQSEGLVRLGRGSLTVTDEARLGVLSAASRR